MTGDRDQPAPPAETSAFVSGDRGPLVSETTQSALLQFLRADALEVYDALDDDARATVDHLRAEYRRETSDPQEDLLTRAAVDERREWIAMAAIVRDGLTVDVDGEEVPNPVAEEQSRITRRQRRRLKKLGFYSTEPGGSV